MGEDPEANLHFAQLLQAAKLGDTREMMRLAPLVPRLVSVNMTRGSIQLWSCSGAAVVANLVVADRAALATLSDRMAGARALAEFSSRARAAVSENP